MLHWIVAGGASDAQRSGGTSVPSESEHACWRTRAPPPQLTEHSPETSSTHVVPPIGLTGGIDGGGVAGDAVGDAVVVGGSVTHAAQRSSAATSPRGEHS